MAKLTKSEHWYTPDGQPAYDADLRRARKEHLLCSVTSIMSVWPKPMLVDWIVGQYIDAAETTPRQPDEDREAWHERVISAGDEIRDSAASWGSDFHALIEATLKGEVVVAAPPYAEHYLAWLKWWNSLNAVPVAMEQVVVNLELGYAGRFDTLIRVNGEHVLLDWKSRSVKKGKPAWYDEQVAQLAAYAKALDGATPVDRFLSIVINRDQPETPYEHWWEPDEVERGWEIFQAALNVWKLHKKWDYAWKPQLTPA